MAGQGGARAGAGRPKGVPNKITSTAKEAIQQAFQAIGGSERLVKWIDEDAKNESAFWTTIYPKLVPHQVTGEDGAALVVNVVRLATEVDKSQP